MPFVRSGPDARFPFRGHTLYSNSVQNREIKPVERPVCGVVRVPGSKSITNRALALAALATGPTELTGALFADDTARMMDCLRSLGFEVEERPEQASIRVTGQGGRIPRDRAELFVGNSGTTARFITPLLALGYGEYFIDGVPRMRERPISDLIGALKQLGVDIESSGGSGCPPLRVRATGLRSGACTVRGDTSSQFLSGLLIASPCAEGKEMRLTVDGPLLSAPYVTLTADIMRAFGVSVEEAVEGGLYVVPAGRAYDSPGTYAIEPDASSASYFWAAAAITGGSVRVEGIGRQSLQGDAKFVEVLGAMGCDVAYTDDAITVTGNGAPRGGRFDMNAISDTAMTLAAVAVFADSPTSIENVGHIRHKETDRLRAITNELGRLGVRVEERADGITIHPAANLNPATIQTYDDHRMAMAFALIGLRSPGVAIADPDCVRKTFPDYFVCLEQLTEGSELPQ